MQTKQTTITLHLRNGQPPVDGDSKEEAGPICDYCHESGGDYHEVHIFSVPTSAPPTAVLGLDLGRISGTPQLCRDCYKNKTRRAAVWAGAHLMPLAVE